MSRAAVLLAVGDRAGRRGGAAALVHRWSLALAGMALVLLGWLLVAVGDAAQARDARIAAREPGFVAQGQEASATARWILHTDYVDHRQFLVLYIEPLRATTPPPPGLTRWPAPGEAFLSPELLRSTDPDRLKHRYGRFAGLIGPTGLADATERLVYLRPATSTAFDEREGPVAITGFGVDPVALGDEYFPNTVNGFGKWTVVDMYVLVLFVIALPVLFLVILATRSNAERRDRRLAMLDSFGAPAIARAWVLIGEAALPVVAGSALGSGLALVAAAVDIRIPIVGYVVWSNDLTRTRLMIAPIAVAAIAFIVSLTLVIQLRGRAKGETRPRKARQRFRGWAHAAFPLGLAAAIWGAQTARGGATSGYSPSIIAFLIGVVVTLASLPSVLGSGAAAVGGLICRFGMRASLPGAVIGGRWLKERPGLVARLCAAFVVGLGLLVQVQVQQQWIIERTRGIANGSAPASVRADDRLVVVRTAATADGVERFVAAIRPDRVLRVFETDGQSVIVGDCESLRQLGTLQACNPQATAVETAFADLSVLGIALRHGTELSNPTAGFATVAPQSGTLAGLVVLNTAGAPGVERVSQAAYANLTKPYVSTPGEDWIAGGLEGAAIFNWVLAFGSVGLVTLALLGTLAAAGMFLTQVKTLGVLSTFEGRVRLYVVIAGWNVGVPLAGAGIVGAVVAAYLGLLTLQIRGTGRLALDVLIAETAVVIGLAFVVTALCGVAAARSVRFWRPTAD